MSENKRRLPRPSKKTVLTVTVAFIAGIVLSAFILGSTFFQMESRAYTVPPPIPTIPPKEAKLTYTEETVESSKEWEYAGRMVIYTAYLKLEVDDVDSTVNEIHRLTEDAGGFIAEVSTSKSGTHKVGVVTIRVPQEKFYMLILEIEGLGEVEGKELKGEDVTERYIDLTARLNNLQKQEQRLLEILGMCDTVEEVLKVEAELNRVRSEIERLTGQIQYLERRIELATITVSLTEKVSKPFIKIPELDWGKSIESGLQGLFMIIQGLITLTIVAAPFIAVGVPIYYLYRRRRKS